MPIKDKIKKMSIPLLLFMFLLLLIGSFTCSSDENLLFNGGFEEIEGGKPSGWQELWTREPDSGRIILDSEVYQSGSHSVRIENYGVKDWCLNSEENIPVTPGDNITLKAWLKIKGEGQAKICVTTYDRCEKVKKWCVGENTAAKGADDWYLFTSHVLIPPNVAWIRPRLWGIKPATIWIDDFSVTKEDHPESPSNDLPAQLTISNDVLSLTLNTQDITLSVTDKRTGQSWHQHPFNEAVLLKAKKQEGIEMIWRDVSSAREVKTVITLLENQPEFTLSISAEGKMRHKLQFPYPFVTEPGTYLVIPMNEGISYPVEDKTIEPMDDLIAFGGHGICMPFWGVTNGQEGHMAIIETPDDASLQIDRINEKLCVRPGWLPQKGNFGYSRHLHYVFFDQGGHVAMAKRYREYARGKGLLKTLSQKRTANPNVDLLIGAVNVWGWVKTRLPIVKEMKALGIERILWSNGGTAEEIKAMNETGGILTSRYDIYSDLMDPELIRQGLITLHPDWIQEGWPEDLMLDENQNWLKGWYVKRTDGMGYYPCGILCDKQALKYARTRVATDLETHPYRARFIDTTTAAPWRECYHPDHQLTRSESRHFRMELLRFMSEINGLVTGSETGHEAAVPYVHYFEGMLSLLPYRLPGAGRDMAQLVEEVPEKLEKFQVGPAYRLPLWELVYHDCVVSHWYWGDYNNKLPALWEKRDLFNILYGTPPMFMFTEGIWENYKDRFVKSYKDVCPVARAVGYSEMIDHRFLLPDRSVQQTVFSNGVKIIVNFGDKPFPLDDTGHKVASLGFQIIKGQ